MFTYVSVLSKFLTVKTVRRRLQTRPIILFFDAYRITATTRLAIRFTVPAVEVYEFIKDVPDNWKLLIESDRRNVLLILYDSEGNFITRKVIKKG